MYEKGWGVQQDSVLALKWYTLADRAGEHTAAEKRDMLVKTMVPAQIAEARRLAQDWKPK